MTNLFSNQLFNMVCWVEGIAGLLRRLENDAQLSINLWFQTSEMSLFVVTLCWVTGINGALSASWDTMVNFVFALLLHTTKYVTWKVEYLLAGYFSWLVLFGDTQGDEIQFLNIAGWNLSIMASSPGLTWPGWKVPRGDIISNLESYQIPCHQWSWWHHHKVTKMWHQCW